jgi:hypothetical protein
MLLVGRQVAHPEAPVRGFGQQHENQVVVLAHPFLLDQVLVQQPGEDHQDAGKGPEESFFVRGQRLET